MRIDHKRHWCFYLAPLILGHLLWGKLVAMLWILKVLWKGTWGEIPSLLPPAMWVYHPGSRYCSSSQAFRRLQPQETDILTAMCRWVKPKVRTTYISYSQIFDPQKSKDNKFSCFKSLCFGVICYSTKDTNILSFAGLPNVDTHFIIWHIFEITFTNTTTKFIRRIF